VLVLKLSDLTTCTVQIQSSLLNYLAVRQISRFNFWTVLYSWCEIWSTKEEQMSREFNREKRI